MWRYGALVLTAAACGRVGFEAARSVSDGGGDDAAVDAVVPIDQQFRKPITIAAGRVAGALDDFPVAVRIVDGDLRPVADGGKLATGVDFDVVASDGVTRWPFEVDRFTPGDLLLWVKVPRIETATATTFYLVFGDPEATVSRADPPAVWTNGFVGVWHFSEGALPSGAMTADARGVHPGAASAGVGTVTGQLGGAAMFGACSTITVPAAAALQPSSITVSAWARPADIGAKERIVTIVAQDAWRAIGSGSQGYYLELYRNVAQPVPTFYVANGPQYAHTFGTTSLANGNWRLLHGTYDAANGMGRVYLDGGQEGTAAMSGAIDYLPKPVVIGCNVPVADGTLEGWWNGGIDEVRIANVPRSSTWIEAEWANQRDPAAFAVVGATEPSP